MIRHFPFSQTYRNFAFNVKNFKPSSHRPAFKSVNHPFMPNAQLQDASYTSWLLKTSSDLPRRVLNHMQRSPTRTRYQDAHVTQDDAGPDAAVAGLYYFIPRDLRVDDILQPSNVSEAVLTAFEHDDLPQVAQLLEDLKSRDRVVVDPDIVSIMIKMTLSEIPMPHFLPYELQVEVPQYRSHLEPMHVDSAFYRYLYARIPALYRICRSYQRLMYHDRDFQEYYIWLCYHQNDLTTMAHLLKAYLQQRHYDSKVLAYAVCLHIVNYDTASAVTIFGQIVASGKPLDPILLELVLQLAIKYDALFEHLQEFFLMWQLRPLTAKAMALMLRVCQRHGSPAEVEGLGRVCRQLGIDNHYMVRAQRLRSRILARAPSQPRKPIFEEDIVEINEVALGLSEPDLADFYYQMMRFFGQQRNMSMVLFVLHKMKDDRIPIDDKFVKVILNFYSRSAKFFSLVDFLKFSAEMVPFNRQYVVDLYEGFVRTYPYLGAEFDRAFGEWARQHSEDLMLYLSVRATGLTLRPYVVSTPTSSGDPFKYGNQWRPVQLQLQVEFWLRQGFPELHRRGVKPDFTLIKETYEVLPRSQRHLVLDVMKQTKSESPRKILAVSRIKRDNYTQNYLRDFLRLQGNGLDAQGRLDIAAELMQKGLSRYGLILLDTIKPGQLDDRGAMIRLHKTLQLSSSCFQMRKFIAAIDEFPVNEVVLSPYLYDKCCAMEGTLLQKIHRERRRSLEASSRMIGAEDEPMIDQLERALAKLRAFIADVRLRLDSDKVDVAAKISETFAFLSAWIEKDPNDERMV